MSHNDLFLLVLLDIGAVALVVILISSGAVAAFHACDIAVEIYDSIKARRWK